jgi:cell division septation protein DedD
LDRKTCATWLLGGAVALAGAATPALAQAVVGATYPKSRSLSDVAAWVATDTPLQLSQVVDVGPSAVTAVTSAAPTGEPRGFLANIASEAIDPSIGRQEDILSWKIAVEIDCDRRAVRLGDMTGYPGRDLKTAPRIVRQGDNQWVQPSGSAPLGAVLRALCDREFKRPFANGTKVASAKSPEARPKPQPPPGPPPTVVALTPPTKPQPLASAAAAEGASSVPAPGGKPAKPAPSAQPVGHGGSPYAVQVGASPSQDDAKGLLGRVQKKFSGELAGLKTDVVAATVDGKQVYRALISGFGGAKDANALCEQLKAGGQACFVRK